MIGELAESLYVTEFLLTDQLQSRRVALDNF